MKAIIPVIWPSQFFKSSVIELGLGIILIYLIKDMCVQLLRALEIGRALLPANAPTSCQSGQASGGDFVQP